MSNVKEVSKTLELDLSGIPRGRIKQAKKEVGDYLTNEILRYVGDGKSPVKGESFQRLQKEYADEEKNGDRTPNLELEGDMWEKLKPKGISNTDPELSIGIYGKSQAPKADGHNQISSEAKNWAKKTGRTQYKRRFIPDEKQTFKKPIMDGVNEILDGFRTFESEDRVRVTRGSISSRTESPDINRVEIDDFFEDDTIATLLLDELKKLGRI